MATTQCPVCGAPVDSQTAPSMNYQGQEYHFCSKGCRDQFVANPSAYVTGS
ncbi:MAG: YHS domain-containing protein [Propionicimonas sp.]|nr:YHS domain-containing protein [Propionicimonas sp.]